MFIDFREEGEQRETSMWERNMDQLPPVCARTGDQTCKLWRMGRPTTEPPSQGSYAYIYFF